MGDSLQLIRFFGGDPDHDADTWFTVHHTGRRVPPFTRQRSGLPHELAHCVIPGWGRYRIFTGIFTTAIYGQCWISINADWAALMEVCAFRVLLLLFFFQSINQSIIHSFVHNNQHKMTMYNWRTGHARLGKSSESSP